jgi:predicted methyltransferase
VSAAIAIPDYIRAAVASPRRPQRDTDRDGGRRPAETLAFFGVKPGDRIAELNSGWGYMIGVLAEAVGPTGRVYSHSTEASNKRWNGNPVEKRIAKAGLGNVELVLGTMDAPNLPGGLDAVFMIMNYHDSVWTQANRPAMNKAIYDALRPGGTFGVIDHHARPGRGTEDCHGIHRIEKSVVVEEVGAAGFRLEAESDILENPDDPCTGQVHEKDIRDRTHRFVLRFRKPG